MSSICVFYNVQVYFKQLQSVQINIIFLKIYSLYRPLLIKHQFFINTVLMRKLQTHLSYNRMIADIFYLIFTLMITVLVCFIQKKLFGGFTPMTSPWTPWGLTVPPRPPAAIVFGFTKNRWAHIFSALSPGQCCQAPPSLLYWQGPNEQ